jgi:acid stress-induced BolA-like protein IbaG/YrbA
MADLEKKVTTALNGLGLANPDIQIHGLGRTIMATVVSGSFSGMDEAERQRMVWEALRENLDEQERAAVEFVFTIAPGERESVEEAV